MAAAPPIIPPHPDLPPPPPPPAPSTQFSSQVIPSHHRLPLLQFFIFSSPLILIGGLIGYLLGLSSGSQLARQVQTFTANSTLSSPSPTAPPTPTPSTSPPISISIFTLTPGEDFSFLPHDPKSPTEVDNFSFLGTLAKSYGSLASPWGYLTFSSLSTTPAACRSTWRPDHQLTLSDSTTFNHSTWHAGQFTGAAAGTTYVSRIYHLYVSNLCHEITATTSYPSEAVPTNLVDIWHQLEAPLFTLTYN